MAVSTPNRPSASITATVIVVKSMSLILAAFGRARSLAPLMA
jgi:hypothetical protein